MRKLKSLVAASVQLLLVFVLTAGPLPLGIPRAEAQTQLPTDTPGINSFYPPYLFIIFDTSQSMGYYPGDLNGYPGYLTQDWDPTTMTPVANDPNCQSKFCLGKRALYVALPQYSSRIYMGLGTYNQYFETASQPPNFQTVCTYDEIAYGDTSFGQAGTFFTSTPSAIGDPNPNSATVPGPSFTCTPPNAVGTHTCIRNAVANANATTLTVKVKGSPVPYGPGSTMSDINGLIYNYWKTTNATVSAPATSFPGGTCPTALTGYTGPLFGCTPAAPCDLDTGTQAEIVYPVGAIYGASQGPTVTIGTNVYNLNGGQPATPSPFTTSCGVSSPYTGSTDGCNGVTGGCTLTSSAPFTVTLTGSSQVYYNTNNPGVGWVQTAQTAQSFNYNLTQLGQSCPPMGSTISETVGPANWQYIATSNYALDHNWQTDPTCGTSLQNQCIWTMVGDVVVNSENPRQYCTFQRTQTTWAPTTTECTYSTHTWSYTYDPPPILTCSLKQYTVYFSRPSYQYTFIPNPGDLMGATNFTFVGNNDAASTPTAVTYSNGAFSNGDCPNLIANNPAYPPCNNGIECKLSWTSNTTISSINYPHGRWSNAGAGPFPYVSPTVIYKADEPSATLNSGLFPPAPLAYGSNWLYGSGHGLLYKVNLYASIYNPALTNPPPSQTGCTGCTYTYSYAPPPYVPSGDAVSSATIPWIDATTIAGNPNVGAVSMPPLRTVGWSQEPPVGTGVPAVTWTAISADNAALGASPATDAPVLRMLSKYDINANPNGLRRPAYGDYTPLTGTMQNVQQYMQTVINADPYAGCRAYFVMLLTDGEEQPANLGLNPVAPVQAMRSPANGGTMQTSGGVPVDIKTFVIGFGLQSAQLNAMAQAGGTSVGPNGVTPDPAGTAFQAVDYNTLLAGLTAAFGNILAGYFTRSQPVANSVGDEIYIGYLKLLANGREWQGFLDAVNPSVPGGTGTYPNPASALFWQYSTSINQQAMRTLYTPLGNASVAGPLSFFDFPGSGWNTNTVANQNTLYNFIDSSDQTDALDTIMLLLNTQVPAGVFQYFENTSVPKLSRASDIYHSIPVIVDTASQSQNWPLAAEATAYKAFTQNNLNRTRNIYIGANDGMLHAITDAKDATGGQERWGYVPQALLPNLSGMRNGHVFGVDGSMAVADVCSGAGCSDPSGNGWTTELIGSLRQGGNALFALDITNPSTPKHLWQQNTPGDPTLSLGYMPRLGQTWSAPVIGRTIPQNLGATWSAFVGGGVAPGADNPTDPWGNAFFVLNALTGTVLNDGTTVARFYVPDDPADPAKNNVAARPTLYRPSDGSLVDRVFFNDTEGKIWRMQVTSAAIANWSPGAIPFFDPASTTPACKTNVLGQVTPIISALTGLPFTSGTTTLPLSRPRPTIYNRPSLGLDPSGNVIVYVGTGNSDSPNTVPSQDYFYAVTDLDNGTCGQPLYIIGFAPNEKVLSTPAFLGTNVILTTYVPPPTTPGQCNDAGQGYLYSFDALSGQPTPTLLDPTTNNYVARVLLQVKDANGNLQSNLGIPTSPIVVTQNNVQSIIVGTETSGGNVNKFSTNVPPVPWTMQGWERVR
jgi:hypothetical protein